MKISLNTLRFLNMHYKAGESSPPENAEQTVQKIGAQLGAVEDVMPFGDKYEGALIVRVVSSEQHPNADRLHVCKVDDDGKAQSVERDENGHVQIVCGAPNVREGMLAVWLPPGMIVPSTYYDIDTFKLDRRELRGVVSNGMLASPKELGLSDYHEGIFEVLLDSDTDFAPGTPFNDACHAHDDVIIDIENKMFTHRPDCFGYIGLAREIEGIHHRAYRSPDWYRMDPEIPGVEAEELPLEVRNEIPEFVPRFSAIAFRDVTVKPSPFWLQVDLARSGLRPVNNIVDYTNWFMLVTGQPLHAYDYDKVKARSGGDKAVITVRHPRAGEKLALLNGKELAPRSEAIMIATDTQLIGVGGVMGGADTEVDEHTKHVIIECANFDMYAIRRTSMEHGLFTDAVTRFTKGQSPLQNLAVIGKIIDEIRRNADGKVASPLIDDNHVPQEVQERGSVHPPVTLARGFVNERLGLELSAEEMRTLLANVEFDVQAEGDILTVKAPFWRTDIKIPEDIVEEIGRLYGYDRLPLELPARDLTPAARDPLLELKASIRNNMSKLGANEVLTYSFVHGDLLDKAGQNRDQAFRIANALSPDLQFYRLSLTPSLLEKVHPNIKAGHDQFALFELGNVHNNTQKDAEGLPQEQDVLACVTAVSDKKATEGYQGAPFYLARTYLLSLLEYYMLPLRQASFVPFAKADLFSRLWLMHAAAPFDPERSAVLIDKKRTPWGVVGEYKSSVRKAFKLPRYVAGFELDPMLLRHAAEPHRYKPLSRFPEVWQDLCLRVPSDTVHETLLKFVSDSAADAIKADMRFAMWPRDIYQRGGDKEHKQVTMRFAVSSSERTLTDAEVNAVLDRVVAAAEDRFGAERV